MDTILPTLLALCVLPFSLASPQAASTTTPASPSNTTTDATPTFSDDANEGGNDNDADDVGVGGLVNVYFLFLALILIVAFVAAYFVWRRKKRLGLLVQYPRRSTLQRDMNARDATRARRGYRHGRWRSADLDHEEGFNEHGEAPPPYMPKSADVHGRHELGDTEPAVPMQTLSRDQAGLKPPDYAATHASNNPDSSSRNASSASAAESEHREPCSGL